MDDIKVRAGRSSMATHRLTQSSTTLNRRYVKRPASLAVEQAAKEAAIREAKAPDTPTPSRLVNLRVRSSDLAAAQAREAEEAAKKQAEAAEAAASDGVIRPNVVEYGGNSTVDNQQIAESSVKDDVLAVEETEQSNLAEPEVENLAEEMSKNDASADTEVKTEKDPQPEIDTAKLALSIATDYAAASMGASIQQYGNNYQNYAISGQEMGNGSGNLMPEAPVAPVDQAGFVEQTLTSSEDSVDAIATAASRAIASIRAATEPAEISEQVASLKAFAENIKANHSAPEMCELGDTIEKFVSVAMKSSKIKEEVAKKNTKTARAAQKVAKSSAKVMAANHASIAKRGVGLGVIEPAHRKAVPKPSPRHIAATRPVHKKAAKKPTAEELKDQAIRQALRSVATMEEETGGRNKSKKLRRKGSGKRLALAVACAVACVGGVVYFVSTNIPDISVKVAALQTGIEAAYPSYVPRDYNLADISSENAKIIMRFDGPDGASFTLDEEKSSWDSAALLRNFVEPNWGDEYATTHEQGITIYISNSTSDAAWVNGGVLYRITSKGAPLTKKQVRSIVTSM